MPVFYLRTFGGLSIEDCESPASRSVIQRGRLAVLAALADAAHGGLSRDQLLALFWPESDSERARGSLRQALYMLRRETGRDDLILGTTSLRLNPEVIRSDLGEFRLAIASNDFDAAVELYRAPFLDGVYLREAPEFERWVESARAALAADHRAALEALARAAAAGGDLLGAAEWWRRLASVDPLSARVALGLMDALSAAGDRESAIRHAATYAELVRADLGAEPDSVVLARAAALRRNGGSSILDIARSELRSPSGAAVSDGDQPGVEHRFTEAPASVSKIGRHSSAPRTKRAVVVAGWIALLAAITATIVLQSPHPKTTPTLVAVAPIRNATGDTSFNRLAELAGQQVTGALVRSGRVDVADLGQLNARSDDETSVGTALEDARKIGAGRVVRGTMFRQGDTLHIEAQIVATPDGRVLHQIEPVVGSSRDLIALVNELRDKVGGAVLALADTLYEPWVQAHSKPPTYEAFQEFIQALDGVARQDSRAIDHLRMAVSLDSTFIEAKLWLIRVADSQNSAHALLATRDTRATAFGDSLLRSALAQRDRLAPFDAATLDYVAAARVHDWETAYIVGQRLMSIAPNTQDAMHLFADAAKNTRRYSEALPVIHRLLISKGWLQPAWPIWQDWDLLVHHMAGDHEGALAHWRDLRQRFPHSRQYCVEGLRHFAAMDDEVRADSLVTVCSALPGGSYPGAEYVSLTEHYLAWGHLASARRAANKVLPMLSALSDSAPPALRRRAGVDLGKLHCMLAEWRQCRDLLRQYGADSMGLGDRVRLAVAAAHLGDTDTVDGTLHAIDLEAASSSPSMPLFIYTEYRAALSLARSDREDALRFLREALRDGDVAPHNRWRTNWMFLPLRGDPAFESLIAPVH